MFTSVSNAVAVVAAAVISDAYFSMGQQEAGFLDKLMQAGDRDSKSFTV